MATFQFKQNFNNGENLDLDEIRMPPNMVHFIKNMTASTSGNSESALLAGNNQEVQHPLEGNVELSITLPAGDNRCVGFYSSEQTNEGYFFIHNSLTNHSIWKIRGDNGNTEKVYQGSLLPLTITPREFIAEGRVTLEIRSQINPSTGDEEELKMLIFTNGRIGQFLISVEDSIATNSYTTPTSYFTGAGTLYDPATLLTLTPPTPNKCMSIESVPFAPTDEELQNNLIKNAWQIRIKNVDVFGRESEHGIISTPYISGGTSGCISGSSETPRCFDITFDAGNPLVDKIQIEFRKWTGDARGTALNSGWFLYDVIEKWDNSMGVKWYLRDINPDLDYNPVTNEITYTFCGDKNCEPISEIETSRTEPDTPRFSDSVFSLNTRIGLANNVRGFEPIDPAEIAKVEFLNVESETEPCPPPELRTIIVYANIYRPFNDASGIIRESNDKIVWGNEDGDCSGATGNSFLVDQVFGDQENPGFIFYLAGTNYSCVATWGCLDLSGPTGVFTPLPDYPGTIPTDLAGSEFMMQIKLTVPAGKYVLRGSSHKSKQIDANYQKTSTYIGGYTTLNAAFAALTGPFARRNYAVNPIKELVIDVSSGDYIANGAGSPMFVILDLSGTNATPIDGYLFEQEGASTPIEMNPVKFNSIVVGDEFGSFFTDHNGFFFGIGEDGTRIEIFTDLCDGAGSVSQFTIYNRARRIMHGYGAGTGSECPMSGNWYNQVYIKKTEDGAYPEEARRRINQRVLLCDTVTGVPYIPVIMTKGMVYLTGADGEARLIAHNRYDYGTSVGGGSLPLLSGLVPNYSVSPASDDLLIFSQRGWCPWTACPSCTPTIPDATVLYEACCPIPPLSCDRIIDMSDVTINISVNNIKGIQSGGRYPVGFLLYDNIGRHTFVQRMTDDRGFVRSPNLNDTSFRKFDLTSIGFDIDPTTTFPSYFQYMTFCVAENTQFTDFFSWSADYVQFVDSTGATNTVNPTQIRIYYGSLNEYNKQFNFATNNGWQFQTTDNASKQADIVEFIMNGDGSWFDSYIGQPVMYDSQGLFFTIEYTDRLKDLINGALFRVIRPKPCQVNYIFYEQCLTIKLVDGVPQTLTGTIPYFDSYILSRSLPVPILQGQPGPIPPGGVPPNDVVYTSTNLETDNGYATTNSNSNNVLVMSTKDALTSFPFYFESPSPSDFSMSHLASRGRTQVQNPYEHQRRIGTEIALSAALTDRSSFNGLSYFDQANVQVFDRNTWGNITTVLVEVGRLLVICNSDHFHLDYNNTQLRQDDEGNIVAQNPDGIFTAPRRPSGTPFGCIPDFINTVRKYEGKVMWLDAAGRLVLNNFSSSVDVSKEDKERGIIGGYSGYLTNKIAAVNILNLDSINNGLNYWLAGIDPVTKEYYLTKFRTETLVAPPTFINTSLAPDLNANETLRIDMNSGILRGHTSFTPEYYGMMPKFVSGKNFFSFRNAGPWMHHKGVFVSSVTYANFYGTQCECVVTPVVNVHPHSEVVKRYLYLEFYTKQNISNQPTALPSVLFYADEIVTEKGQLSRLLVDRFDIRDGYQCAAFLCDLNTPTDPNLIPATTTHRIFDGNPLMGRWAKVRMRTNSEWAGTYFEVSGIITYGNGVEPTDKQQS